jgi:hypothetical protein
VLAAWLAGAAAPSLEPAPIGEATADAAPEVDRESLSLAASATRIRERLHVTAAARPVTRNPFRFAARETRPPAPPAAAARAAARVWSVPAPPPRIRLLGLAEDAPGTDSPGRTAILSLDGGLLLVKEGEPIGDRYRVARIGGDAVVIEDLEDTTASRTFRLALP